MRGIIIGLLLSILQTKIATANSCRDLIADNVREVVRSYSSMETIPDIVFQKAIRHLENRAWLFSSDREALRYLVKKESGKSTFQQTYRYIDVEVSAGPVKRVANDSMDKVFSSSTKLRIYGKVQAHIELLQVVVNVFGEPRVNFIDSGMLGAQKIAKDAPIQYFEARNKTQYRDNEGMDIFRDPSVSFLPL